MSQRAQQLADQFGLTVAEFKALIERCDDSDWRLICAAEQWPVSFVAQHVALAIRFHLGWLRSVAVGDPRLDATRAELDQTNAHFAARFADVRHEQVLRLLRRNATTARTFVAALSDEELARTAEVVMLGGAVVSLDQLIEHILIGHIMGHLLSIERTLQT